MVRVLLVLAALLYLVAGYGYYRDAMPNGRRIPCDSSCVGYCEGFGHVLNDGSKTCQGGGEHPNHYLSSFGNTWQNYLSWTVDMCKADSDGDGATNGDEMGDPCCVWVAGGTPSRTVHLSNPAIKDSSFSYPSCTLTGAPTINISTSTVTQSSALFTWISASCMCGFNISQTTPTKINNMHSTLVSDPVSGSSQFSITGLEPGTTYQFEVRGYNLGGGTPTTINITTPAVPTTAPAAPASVALSSSTSNSLTISWVAPTATVEGSSLSVSDITAYELDLASASDGIYSTVYSGLEKQYTAQALQPHSDYLARVRAVNADGVGLSSLAVNLTTAAYNSTKVSANYTAEDGVFHLGWAINGDVITFEMTGTTLGYVAVGWGSTPTMSDSDMVVGSFDSSSGTGSVIDLWSSSRSTPTFDTIQDATYVSGTQTTTTTTITFTRRLSTNDSTQDIAITNKGMYLVWSIGSGVVTTQSSFSVHTKRGAASINFFTGDAQNVNKDKLKNAHAGLAFFAWGILIPLGSFIARYKRCDMGVWWFRAHVAMQIFGSVLTFISFILIASALGTQSPHFASTHAICGLIMLLLTVGQNVMGFVSHFMYNKNRKKVPIFPDRVHGVLGLATLMFGFITIFLGFDFYNVNLGVWLLGAQCLLFAFTGTLVYEFFDGKEEKEE